MTSLAKNLQEFADIMQQIEDNGGEITNEMLPTLTSVECAVADKIDSYVSFYDVISGQIDKTKKTIENFKQNLQTLENLQSRLKSNVKTLMESYELVKIEGKERSIKLVNSGGVQATEKPSDMFYQLECIDEKYLEELKDYIELKVCYVLKDKNEFKEAIKNDKIKSCYLLPRGKYVKFS